jgi:transposase
MEATARFWWVALEAYSMDLRSRVIADCDAGLGTKEAAEKYKVSRSWVRKLKQIRRETGQIGPRTQRVSHATKLDGHVEELQRLVELKPDATLRELREQLGVKVGLATIARALVRLRLTFKKKSYTLPSSSVPMFTSSGCSGKS